MVSNRASDASCEPAVSLARDSDFGAEVDSSTSTAPVCTMFDETGFDGAWFAGACVPVEATMNAGRRISAQAGKRCPTPITSRGMAKPASSKTLQAVFCARTFFTRRRRRPAQRAHAAISARKAASNRIKAADAITISLPSSRLVLRRPRFCWLVQFARPDAEARRGPKPWSPPCPRAAPPPSPRKTNP